MPAHAVLSGHWSRTPHIDPALKLRRSDILVLNAIARYTDASGQAWPKMQTLAEDTGIARPHVARAVGRLEQAGLLTRQNPTRGGRGRPNLYTLIYDAKPATTASPAKCTKRKSVPSNVIKFPANVTPVGTPKVTAQEGFHTGSESCAGRKEEEGSDVSPRGGLLARLGGWLRGLAQ